MPRSSEEDRDDEIPSDEEGTEAAEEPSKRSRKGKKAEAAPVYTPREMDLSTRIKRWLRTYRFGISIVVAVIGFVIFFLGLFAFTPISLSGPLSPIEQSLLGSACTAGPNWVNGACTATGPNWTLAMLPGGGLLGIIGAYLAVSYEVARRRFEHLMKTKSKAEFLRNVTEAEDLLWDLTPEDEIRLVRKKQDLKIRT